MRQVSPKKLEANRRNAECSTGPRTGEGKSRSRRNALQHGVLASALLITEGIGSENSSAFNGLLGGLREDLAPVGMLEDLLVQKIAICCWRQRRALQCEAQLFKQQFVDLLDDLGRSTIEKWDAIFKHRAELDLDKDKENTEDARSNQYLQVPQDFLKLPLGLRLDQVLRYETTIHRQLAYAINQLERLQRARRGDHVPAPVAVQLSTDQD